jgi:hypothetical protein
MSEFLFLQRGRSDQNVCIKGNAHFLLRVEEKMRIVMNLLCVAKIYTISLSREWYKYL